MEENKNLNETLLDEIHNKKEKIKQKMEEQKLIYNRKLPFFRRFSVKISMNVAITAIIMGAIICITFAEIIKSSNIFTLQSISQPTAQVTSTMIESKVDSYLGVVKSIADSAIMRDDDISINQKVALVRNTIFPMSKGMLKNVDILNKSGDSLTGGQKYDLNKIAKNVANISSPFYDANKNLVVAVTVPTLLNSSYPQEVYTILTLDAKLLTNILLEAVSGENGYAYMINETGTVIASTNRYDMVEGFFNSQNSEPSSIHGKIEAKMLGGESGVDVYKENNGLKYILAYSPITNLNWTVGVGLCVKDYSSIMTRGIIICSIISLALTIIAVVIAVINSNRMTKPIFALSEASQHLAQGKFDIMLTCKSNDELGILIDSFIMIIKNLDAIIKDITLVMSDLEKKDLMTYTKACYFGEFRGIELSIRNVRDSVKSALQQISEIGDNVATNADSVAGNIQSLAQGATEQAASIEELSATINEIYEKVIKNADDAGVAARVVEATGKTVDKSSEYMDELVKAMGDINYKSTEIGKIVKTIDDIAFQTNILALNAAVEAARAGAAGKGFAVVADEVRNLAQKSAEAAQHTTKLITEATDAVNMGSVIVEKTASALGEVVESTKETKDIVMGISDASIEQADSINQVTSLVDQISKVVQNTSISAEQTAEASDMLNSEASHLDSLIKEFKLQ